MTTAPMSSSEPDNVGSPPGIKAAGFIEGRRVEAFSDGVLAIVITLLVLDLHAPTTRGRFLHELVHQWPAYIAYFASFAYAGVIWLNHHQLFTRIAAVNVGLLWRNLWLLLSTSVLPYPTAVLGSAFQHGSRSDEAVALVFYCALAAVMATTWLTLFHYLCGHPELHDAATPRGFFAAERMRSILGLGAYLLAAAISAWQPIAALALIAALPVFYGITNSGWAHRAAHK